MNFAQCVPLCRERLRKGRPLFADITVDIAPAAVVAAHEAAQLVQPVRASAHFVAGNEFDGGMIGVAFGECLDLQSEPTRCVGRRGVRVEIGGAGVRRPGGAQIIRCTDHIRAVARAHQFECARRGITAVDIAAAALREAGHFGAAALSGRSAPAGTVDGSLQ
ncbi:hypothetical protein BN2475_100153 [Paraburkholderia ribeironis]|uniref:Uncharacterized protein n=1 Tax=Paraburkholderia ribeironis TaxID=1247936 RepID=A0A1N7RPW6_9BURK|nr:hypothetical protein BN2475_100153 [Paraburkholderia ribeironis]